MADGGSSADSDEATPTTARSFHETPAARALFKCGMGRLQLGDMRGAYEDFKEAARIDPQDMEIWQRYELTYRAVELEMEEEHARSPGDGAQERRSQSTSSQERRADRADRSAPRHFTIKPGDKFVPVARSGFDLSGGPSQGRQYSESHRRSSASSYPGFLREEDEEDRLIKKGDCKFVSTISAWVFIWLMVMFHYLKQQPREVGHRGKITWLILASVGFWFVVGQAWHHRNSAVPITYSMSFAVKTTCIVIISLATSWHYCIAD